MASGFGTGFAQGFNAVFPSALRASLVREEREREDEFLQQQLEREKAALQQAQQALTGAPAEDPTTAAAVGAAEKAVGVPQMERVRNSFPRQQGFDLAGTVNDLAGSPKSARKKMGQAVLQRMEQRTGVQLSAPIRDFLLTGDSEEVRAFAGAIETAAIEGGQTVRDLRAQLEDPQLALKVIGQAVETGPRTPEERRQARRQAFQRSKLQRLAEERDAHLQAVQRLNGIVGSLPEGTPQSAFDRIQQMIDNELALAEVAQRQINPMSTRGKQLRDIRLLEGGGEPIVQDPARFIAGQPELEEVKVGQNIETRSFDPLTGQTETIATAPRFQPGAQKFFEIDGEVRLATDQEARAAQDRGQSIEPFTQDKAVSRLELVGKELGLTPEDMANATPEQAAAILEKYEERFGADSFMQMLLQGGAGGLSFDRFFTGEGGGSRSRLEDLRRRRNQ